MQHGTSHCNWNASLTVRCDSSHPLSSSPQTGTHTADFLFDICNATIRLALPPLLWLPVTSFPRLFLHLETSPPFDPALRLNSSSPVHIRIPSESGKQPWSDILNASGISYGLYLEEEVYLTGIFISSVLYGTCRRTPPARPPVRAHFACSVYSRDPHCTVLRTYGGAV